jgi:hypothetical protein
MNTTKQLIQYSAVAASFIVAGNVDAQTIYTDIDPDVVIGGEGAEYFVDINEDDIDDFRFWFYTFNTYYFTVNLLNVVALNDNQIVGGTGINYYGYTFKYFRPVDEGEIINADNNFVSGSIYMAYQVKAYENPLFAAGYWLGVTEGIMAFRIITDSDSLYGWMRLSLGDNSSPLTIHDYAYEQSENYIVTDSIITPVASFALNNISLYSFNNYVYISMQTLAYNIKLQIFNLAGNLVKEQNITGINHVVNCADLPEGIYIAKILDGVFSTSDKIYISQ